jgi:hypothetical protein
MTANVRRCENYHVVKEIKLLKRSVLKKNIYVPLLRTFQYLNRIRSSRWLEKGPFLLMKGAWFGCNKIVLHNPEFDSCYTGPLG